MQRTSDALGEWLTPAYAGALSLEPDIDDIPALSAESDALWSRLNAATFLTNDEKRAVAGYGPSGQTDPGTEKFNLGQLR